MNFQNSTKNQHFIPQVEQRLNAINPNAKISNQKTYAFNLIDRESCQIELDNENGFKISNTLSLHDLFSFDVIPDGSKRYNFEALFNEYERSIKTNTESLLEKLSNNNTDIKSEVLEIFVSKYLNFIRNPYSIKKILNTFPSLLDVKPTDSQDLEYFNKVVNGRKPQQIHLCDELGITIDEYKNWLTVIFMLLHRFKNNEPNILEEIIRELYVDPNHYVQVHIYKYDQLTCVLSDRGFTLPIPDDKHMAMDFNLCSNAFIRYGFADIRNLQPTENVPKHIVELYRKMPKNVDVHYIENNLEALSQYNINSVYQCHQTIFNSSSECYGL